MKPGTKRSDVPHHLRSHGMTYSVSYCGARDASGLIAGSRGKYGVPCSKCVEIRDQRRAEAKVRLQGVLARAGQS